MVSMTMGEVVVLSEGRLPRIGYPSAYKNGARRLVAQMFTDAVFNQDIRVIQSIINRIDGGLPLDYEVSDYQTLFGDALNDVLKLSDMEKAKVFPTDTLLTALCKSLYDLAGRDIYGEAGQRGNKRPSTEAKQERDAALRIVLERAGGRKTTPIVGKAVESVGVADWVKQALPSADVIDVSPAQEPMQDSQKSLSDQAL